MNTLIAHHVTTLLLIRDLDAATSRLSSATRSNGTITLNDVKDAKSALLTHIRTNVLPTRERIYMRIIGACVAARPLTVGGQTRANYTSRTVRDFATYAFCTDTDLAVNAHSWGIDMRQLITDDDIATACKAWAHKLRVYMDDTFITDIIAHMRKGGTFWVLA